jgi:hypothetical protein
MSPGVPAVVRRLLVAAGLLAPAGAFAFPLPPLAAPAEVRGIAAEIDFPAVLPPPTPAPPPLARLAYPAAAIKGYGEDVPLAEVRRPENAAAHPFRQAVLGVLGELRAWANDGRQLRPMLPADVTFPVKADLAREQDELALRAAALEAARAKLDALEPLREREPKRWQAHYDLARAEVLTRLARMQEYNLLLGQARQENLPPLDPARHVGYRLRAAAQASGKGDIRALNKEAREHYQQVIEAHPNTPWAVAARRALAAPQGLAWEPAPRE